MKFNHLFKALLCGAAAVLLALPLVRGDEAASEPVRHYDHAPGMTIDPAKHYTATIDTDKGKIVCELFAKDAPKTVNNFVFLAQHHFYDGLTFYRVLPNFVIQAGNQSGPGYEFEDEMKNNPHKHLVGTLAMANHGPNTNSSEFFILKEDAPWLDESYTPFGQLTAGQDVVEKIQQGDHIKSITIDDGDHPTTKP